MKTNYKSKEELIAKIRLTVARKNEYIAKVQREWAEQNVKRIQNAL